MDDHPSSSSSNVILRMIGSFLPPTYHSMTRAISQSDNTSSQDDKNLAQMDAFGCVAHMRYNRALSCPMRSYPAR